MCPCGCLWKAPSFENSTVMNASCSYTSAKHGSESFISKVSNVAIMWQQNALALFPNNGFRSYFCLLKALILINFQNKILH